VAKTFEEACRLVQLRVPLASALLVEDWVQNAWARLCDRRRWSFLRGEDEIILSPAHTGTVNVTHGSATVTGVGMTFVDGDVDRQFRLTANPYTIISVAGANTCVLDRPWGPATAAAATGVVFDGYVNMPEDFGSFWGVLDPARNDVLDWWMTEDELNIADPDRGETGEPRALASRRLATTTAYLGRIQYEAWPYWVNTTDTRRFPYYYSKRPAAFTEDDNLLGPFRHRHDILVLAALEEAAEWPGPELTKPNPYFNLKLSERKRDRYEEEMEQLERVDEEIYLTWLETVPWMHRRPVSGGDYRSHE
jgi:hypothetical protein